jgi:hypothetical protein
MQCPWEPPLSVGITEVLNLVVVVDIDIMVVNAIATVRSRALLRILFDLDSTALLINFECPPRH